MNVSSRTSTPPPSCFCAVNNHGANLLQAGHYKHALDVLTVGLKQVRDQMAINKKATAAAAGHMPCSSTSTAACCSICSASYYGNSSSTTFQATARGANDDNKASDFLGQRLSTEECMLPLNEEQHSNAAPHGVDHLLTHATTTIHDTAMCLENTAYVPQDPSLSEDQEHEHFLFRLPMFVPNNRHISLGTISFMMIFNMALSYDLMSESAAIANDQADMAVGLKSKTTALKLYQLAYKVQDGEGNSEVPLLYLCGLLNNMARLYIQTTNDREMVNWCLAYLLSILMYYTTEKQQRVAFSGEARHTPHLESYFLSKFFHSTSAIILKDPATAGAA